VNSDSQPVVASPGTEKTGDRSLIELRNIRKSFGAVTALDGVDLDVAAGEVVVLLGPNGAGKSTMLRVLATTVLPDSGTATINGTDVIGHPVAARQSTGLVLGDERSWYWRLTGRANLEFFSVLYGLKRKAARERADSLLSVVGLSGAADRPFSGYSSGMRARLSFARALILEPPALLLDEPTNAMDTSGATELRSIVTETARSRGQAVLWITHDLHEATSIADRLVLLSDGRIDDAALQVKDAAELERWLLTPREER
jgi:ABC-2 type transport system ATP-binding protein